MLIFFLLVIILWVSLYLLSKEKFDEYIEPLDKKIYPFRDLMPMGFYVMYLIRYKYSNSYDHKLLMKVVEISGHKFGMYYLQVHFANKVVYILLGLLLSGIFSISMEPGLSFVIFALGLIGVLFYLSDAELDEKIRKRYLKIQLEFPEFLNKMTLLINAGMTVSAAWQKIVKDNQKDSPLYLELEQVAADISSGKPEVHAYEDFAKRCRMPEVSKFISVIVQNLKKGNAELVSILRVQSNECWEQRKHTARRLGEEAGTKMLFPMMIMFVAILIIVALPAVLALQGI